jgi:DNA-binding beta-propeller fold protein YncE
VSAHSLASAIGVATDPQGRLYVADSGNNRVLEFDAPLTGAGAADHVFGQPSLITDTANFGGISGNSLNDPIGLATDGQGNLYVADTGNNRLLEFDAPLTTNPTADRVFGQPSPITGTANTGGISALSLNFPTAAALDAQGNLYLADADNNRVLEYDRPLPLLGLFLPLLLR